MTIEKTCPQCGLTWTCFTVEYNDRKVVFDACQKCGIKLTDEHE